MKKISKQFRYYLGEKYKGTYLTYREAQCIAGLMKGYSNKDIADHLKLSAATVSFYINNVKLKMSCHSKKNLRLCLYEANFLSFVNKIYADGPFIKNINFNIVRIRYVP